MKEILVIVVTYNAINWIDKCLSSVYYDVNCDIFIVDNGSNDGTQKYILATFPKVIFFQNAENIGFGQANNIGIKYAIKENYKYVYLLNQDAWILDNTISKLIEAHKNHPEYGILSPFQIQANMKFLDKIFGENVCSYSSNPEILNDLYFKRKQDVYSIPFVMAAHWLISRECFCSVGGFSPTFPHYGEDNNYIDRAIFHGYKIGILPDCVGVHDRENRNNSSEKILYLNYISNLVLLSNINNKLRHPILICILNTLKSTIKYKSFKPIVYTWEIIKSYKKIKINANNSKHTGAFINNK